MNISRRDFFKGMSVIVGVLGTHNFIKPGDAFAKQGGVERKEGKITIEWLGHGSFLFTSCQGKRILLDPWINTNPKCPNIYREDGGFGSVDFILWTHGHVDHFMLPDAKQLIKLYNPKIIAPWELDFFVKTVIPSAQCQTFVLGNKGATADFDGIKITMVEAIHSSGAQLTGFEGANKFVGEAVGYIIEFENGLKIYHSGDTSLMGDMKTIIGNYYKPDIAILPIGGVFTMGPDEAAFACTLIRPKIVIPEHYGTFPVLEKDATGFKRKVNTVAPEVKVMVLEPGRKTLI